MHACKEQVRRLHTRCALLCKAFSKVYVLAHKVCCAVLRCPG